MEVLILRQLKHPNVIPLLGIDANHGHSIVTPWQDNGTINTYIKSLIEKKENPDFPRLVCHRFCYVHDLDSSPPSSNLLPRVYTISTPRNPH